MKQSVITFRSVTPAQRARNVLGRGGITCYLSRAPRWMVPEGCGYCLQIREEQLSVAVNLLRREKLSFGAVYSCAEKEKAREIRL